jgi:ribosomal protein S18 acetylase RimI-like enzyme
MAGKYGTARHDPGWKPVIRLTQFASVHIDGLVDLSRRLEGDSVPNSYWGMNAALAGDLLQNPNKRTFVALRDEALAGIGTLTRGEFYQYHLAELSVAVDPGHRKAGVARTLLQRLEETAREQKIELLKAMVSTNNLPSRRLFESLGFEHRATLYAEFKSAEFGEIDDCVYYKRLGE